MYSTFHILVKYQLMIWFPPPAVLVRIASNVPAAIFGPNGIIRSSPTSFATKSMMLMITAKIKLKNSDNSESYTPRNDPRTRPNFTSPKPRASFLNAHVPSAPITNKVPPNAIMP